MVWHTGVELFQKLLTSITYLRVLSTLPIIFPLVSLLLGAPLPWSCCCPCVMQQCAAAQAAPAEGPQFLEVTLVQGSGIMNVCLQTVMSTQK